MVYEILICSFCAHVTCVGIMFRLAVIVLNEPVYNQPSVNVSCFNVCHPKTVYTCICMCIGYSQYNNHARLKINMLIVKHRDCNIFTQWVWFILTSSPTTYSFQCKSHTFLMPWQLFLKKWQQILLEIIHSCSTRLVCKFVQAHIIRLNLYCMGIA